jgi:hypothetical protein
MSSRSTTVTPSFVFPAVCARDGRHKQCHQTGVQHLAHCHLLLVFWGPRSIRSDSSAGLT